MRRARRFAAALLLLPFLAACGDESWFGSSEDPPLPGKRIDILDFGSAITVDPELAGQQTPLDAATDGAWPQPYGGGAHDAGHRALAPNASFVWSIDIGAGSNGEERRIVYPPVASETAIFTLDADGEIAAWTVADGDRIWRFDPVPEDEEDGFGGGLAYDDGKVYFAAGFAQVIALDAANGQEIWRVNLPTPSRAAPAVDGGRVFVITVDNRLIAMDAETGRLLWTFDSPPAAASLLGGATPAAAGGAVVAATTTGELVAFRAANGRITWDDSLTAVRRIGVAEAIPAVRALPVISGGQVVAIGAAGLIAGIDFATGSRQWDVAFGGPETPAISGGHVFLTTDRGQLAAIRLQDGRVVWATDMRSAAGDIDEDDASIDVRIYAGPVAAGGQLIVVRGDGVMLFFNAADGQFSRRVELSGQTYLAPIVANRTLYVLTDRGVLEAYR